jgi:hypothetical protein
MTLRDAGLVRNFKAIGNSPFGPGNFPHTVRHVPKGPVGRRSAARSIWIRNIAAATVKRIISPRSGPGNGSLPVQATTAGLPFICEIRG